MTKIKYLFAVTLLALASTASAAITLTNCRTQTVTQRSPCEITLTSVATPANPYRDYTVTGTFTHVPTGKVYSNVLGFYDGASSGRAIFKVRFNPMVDGQYNYSISSSPADTGLAASGSFTAQPSTLRGFLRRSGNYPEDPVFDNTDRIFLWGMTYYQIINNALATGAAGPWKTAINTVADSYLINKIRLLVFPWWGDFSGQFNGTYVDAVPFFQKPSCAGDPRTCLNHDSIRFDHFRALDDVVFHLNSKNMVAELVMFKDHATVSGGTVIDGFRTFGTVAQDVKYTKYILARYAAFPNVTWCLTNEWNQNNMPTKAYWEIDIGKTVRAFDPYFVSPSNLVRFSSIHAKGTPTFEFYGNRAEWNNDQWASHVVMQYHQNNPQGITDALTWGYQGIRGNLLYQQNNGIPGMPVSNDEYGYIQNVTRDQARQTAWGIAVAGGYGTMGDRRPVPGTVTPYLNPVGTNEAETTIRGEWVPASSAEYSDVRHLINFFANPTLDATKVQAFFRMRFQDGVIASGDRAVAGGQTAIQYVVYDANGGTVTVNLPHPQNAAYVHYTVQVYNPRTGVWGATTTVNYGNGIALPAQAAGSDWAYLIKQAP